MTRIDRETWEAVNRLRDSGIRPWMIELRDGTTVNAETLYWTFYYGFDFLKLGERLEYIVLDDSWTVIEARTTSR